jgi:hypothetical protein
VCTLIAVGALALAACEPLDPVDTGNTQVEVWLTDAAADYIEVADVDIGAVTLAPLDGDAIALADDGTSGEVDLLRLRDQNPIQLAKEDVTPGLYTQLRITIESARVELDAAYAFTDGTRQRDMTIPDGARGGVALNLDVAGVEDDSIGSLIVEAGRLIFMVDFDTNQSFVIQGDPEATEGITDIVFSPALRVVAQSAAGSIAGTVTSTVPDIDAAGVVVTARPLSQGVLGIYQTQTATATTGPDGTYTIEYVPAGRYAVNVEAPDGAIADPGVTEATLDVAEDVTGVDFTLGGG